MCLKTKSTIEESGKLQRRHSSYAKVRTQKVGSPASQPASHLVRQSQSLRARPFRASQCTVLQWPRYPTQQKRKEGSSGRCCCWRRRLLAAAAAGGCWRLLLARRWLLMAQRWLLAAANGGCWRRRLLAAASEKGPYFFSLAASACLVGRSPFTVLRKVSTFLMPFLEIPGLFRHL